MHCLAEHSICEEEPVKNGDGKPAVAEDSNIPGNVAAEAGGFKAEDGNTTDIEVSD